MPFQEWLVLKREKLHRQVLDALVYVTDYYEQTCANEQARHYALRWLELESWDEAAHRCLMRVYAAQGNRAAALAQYDHCCRLLQDEFDSTPGTETTSLYEAIRDDIVAIFAAPLCNPRTGTPLPTPPTPLVGRTHELALLRTRLIDPECRLITIVGGFGVGKTHLALEAAQASAPMFREGAVFVPLATVTNPSCVAMTICLALGVVLRESRDAETALIEYLRTREVLLLLDTFEHLLDSASLLARITASAPTVTLLVTAQVPLALQAEWLITLGGLAYPDAVTTEKPDTFAAVQLFLQRACQVAPHLGWPGGNLPAIAQICRYLGGLPLGIELAVNWVRTLSCAEIAAALQQNPDVLTSTAPDIPERHRSLQMVLDATWERLNPNVQRVYCRLAIFEGDFTCEAAAQVAQATLHDLQDLIAASLLHRLADGRYRVHHFVHQDAAMRLGIDSVESAEIAERHARYFAAWLAAQEPLLKGSNQTAALAAIDKELDNIRAAWQWMLAHRQPELFAGALLSLFIYHEIRGWHGENAQLPGAAVALFAAADAAGAPASDSLPSHAVGIERIVAEATFLGYYGWVLIRRGQLAAAQRVLEQGLTLLEQARQRHSPQAARLLGALGISLLWQEQSHTALPLIEEAVLRARQGEDAWEIAMSQFTLGVFHAHTAHYDRARHCFLTALHEFRRLGNLHGIITSLWWLGDVARSQDDVATSRVRYTEGATLAQQFGLVRALAHHRYGLGELACQCTDYHDAQQFYTESLEIFQTLGEWHLVALVQLGLAHVAYALGHQSARDHHLQAALAAIDKIDIVARQVQILQRFGEILEQVGRTQQGEHLRAALAHHAERHQRLAAEPDDPVCSQQKERTVGMALEDDIVSLTVVLAEMSLALQSNRLVRVPTL